MRLDKFLSNMGLGTRSEVKKKIVKGLVEVDGQVIKKIGHIIDPSQNTISLDGQLVSYSANVYLMLNKPQGVITATEDSRHETVLDLIKGYGNRKLFPVGRLDKDTEGLLLITDDGPFTHQLMAPKKHVDKTYFARISGRVTDDHIKAFQAGVTLEDGYVCKPGHLEIIRSDEVSEIHLTITEGKFHQVKRMFQAYDMKVIYLKRIRIGSLTLDDNLPLGQVRELSPKEVQDLRDHMATNEK